MIGVLVSGSGTNLQALIDDGLPIAAVASNKAGVRALERAAAAGIPTAVFELEAHASRDARDRAMADWLERHAVDAVVCAGYMHLLTPAFLHRFAGRVINVHPSLLPAFPGTHAVADALAAGVAETGVTVHLVDVPDEHLTNLGSKGLGEPPIVPTAAAIANAIRDATGADVRELPISREEMLRALREAEARDREREKRGAPAAV